MKSEKYFTGPTGVYYNPKSDQIFYLERLATGYLRCDPRMVVCLYDLQGLNGDKKKHKNVLVTGGDALVRLGDL